MSLHVGSSKNGRIVKVDLANSSAADTISRHPHLVTLAGEALRTITLNGERSVITYDMGHTLGYDFVIEVTKPETVFYAQLVKGTTYIPFTKIDKPISTQLITMTLLYRQDEGCYYLDDICMGVFKPPLPGTNGETPDSLPYWRTHAYIYGNQPIKVSTITRESPYA